MRAAPVYLLLPELLQPRNFPGSPIGLPGGGRHRNRAHNCARSSPMLPGSAEAHSGNTGIVFAFPCQFFAAPGGLGWCSSVPGIALWLGALKDKKHVGGQKPPTCFGTSCASGAMGLVWGHRGVINETVINEEALFSVFHIGDVGVGVLWGCRGGGCGRLVVTDVWGVGWLLVCCQSTQELKKTL